MNRSKSRNVSDDNIGKSGEKEGDKGKGNSNNNINLVKI